MEPRANGGLGRLFAPKWTDHKGRGCCLEGKSILTSSTRGCILDNGLVETEKRGLPGSAG